MMRERVAYFVSELETLMVGMGSGLGKLVFSVLVATKEGDDLRFLWFEKTLKIKGKRQGDLKRNGKLFQCARRRKKVSSRAYY